MKALQGARLPETEAEWELVKRVLVSLAPWLKDNSCPEDLLADLRELGD